MEGRSAILLLAGKIRALIEAEIRPIVCFGESTTERNKSLTLNKLEQQVFICFEGLSGSQIPVSDSYPDKRAGVFTI
jgi:triosephosphate isomerase